MAGERRSPPSLLHVFSNFVPTGPEMRTVRLIAAFGDAYRHAIVSMDGRTDAAARLPPDAPVRLLAAPPRAGSLATALRLAALLRRERPDLVLTYNWGAFDMLLAAGAARFRRLVHHEEGFNEDEAAAFKRRRVLARRLVLPAARTLVVPSRRLAAVATELWRLPPERVRLIPNGVELAAFAPDGGAAELRARLGIPAQACVAGGVGSLRAVKAFGRLLEAAAALPRESGVHVLLVGDGEERPALAARAARPDLAGRVHLAGYQAEPAPFYRAMDLFALPSESEQMPVALLEAMASALPVAATDVGDVREVLPPEQAPFVVPLAGDPAAGLACAIDALRRDPALRRRLGDANRTRVLEHYGFAAMRDAYRAVWEEGLAA